MLLVVICTYLCLNKTYFIVIVIVIVISGILLNHISDHQLLITFIENLSYIEKVPKFINIQKTDPLSVDTFINELREQIYMIVCISHWKLIPMTIMRCL